VLLKFLVSILLQPHWTGEIWVLEAQDIWNFRARWKPPANCMCFFQPPRALIKYLTIKLGEVHAILVHTGRSLPADAQDRG
jgi:hypothetical protein